MIRIRGTCLCPQCLFVSLSRSRLFVSLSRSRWELCPRLGRSLSNQILIGYLQRTNTLPETISRTGWGTSHDLYGSHLFLARGFWRKVNNKHDYCTCVIPSDAYMLDLSVTTSPSLDTAKLLKTLTNSGSLEWTDYLGIGTFKAHFAYFMFSA